MINDLEKEFYEKEKQLKELQKLKKQQDRQQNNLKVKESGKDIRKLENELEKKIKKISNYRSKNNQLRNSINNLRKEKIIYQNIFNSIQKEVDQYEKDIKESTSKLKNLEKYKKNIKEKIVKKVSDTKQEKKLANDGYMMIKKQLEKTSKDFFKQENQNLEKSQSINDTQIIQPQSENIINLVDFKEEEDQIQNEIDEIDNLFTTLYKETNTDNIDSLINHYNNLEEENSRQYKETQQLIEEIDKLKDKKLSMQLELKNFINSKEQKQTVKQDIVKEMQTDLKQLNIKLDQIKNQKEDMKVVVNSLKMSLPVILDRINFDNSLDLQDNLQLENCQVPDYLYLLEKQTNKILKLVQINGLKSQIFTDEQDNNKGAQKKTEETKHIKFQNNLEEFKKSVLQERRDFDNHQLQTKQDLINNVSKGVDRFFKKAKNQFNLINLFRIYYQFIVYQIYLIKLISLYILQNQYILYIFLFQQLTLTFL